MEDDIIAIEDIDIEYEEELPPELVERSTLIPDYDVAGFARAVTGETPIAQFGVPSSEDDDTPTGAIPAERLSVLVRASASAPPIDETWT